MRHLGCPRVSTSTQGAKLQFDALIAVGVQKRGVFADVTSASRTAMGSAGILPAAWRRFRGAVVSSASIASIAALNGSSRRDTPCLGLRSGGKAEVRACLTVLRWTPCPIASARTESTLTRAALRIRAIESTLDFIETAPITRISRYKTYRPADYVEFRDPMKTPRRRFPR